MKVCREAETQLTVLLMLNLVCYPITNCDRRRSPLQGSGSQPIATA
jgi:hypothetical protein